MQQLTLWDLGPQQRQEKVDSTTLVRIRRLLENGSTLRRVADKVGIDFRRVHEIAKRNNFPRSKHRRLTTTERTWAIRQIESDVPQAMIAQQLNRNKSTISRLAMTRRGVTVGIQFRAVRTQRCPKHGAINVWPCVACAAERRTTQR